MVRRKQMAVMPQQRTRTAWKANHQTLEVQNQTVQEGQMKKIEQMTLAWNLKLSNWIWNSMLHLMKTQTGKMMTKQQRLVPPQPLQRLWLLCAPLLLLPSWPPL